MKAIIPLLLVITIGSLAWDAWLQIKINHLEGVTPSTFTLPDVIKAKSLQIVDENGKVVIDAFGEKGVGTLRVTGLIIVNSADHKHISLLDENQLALLIANPSDPDKTIPIAIIQNDKGMGRLHLLNGGIEGTSFDAFAQGIGFTDSKSGKNMGLNSDSLIFEDPKNADASVFSTTGVEMDTITGNSAKPFTYIASLENDSGQGKLHVQDLSQPGTSLTAMATEIFSFDSVKNQTNWEIPLKSADAALIDVNSKAFSTAKSSEGTFLVSCQGAEPYLEGYKVHLEVGNPTTLMVNNPTITIQWGPAFSPSNTDKNAFTDWQKSLRQTTTTLGESLKPGFWNDVDVIVSPAKANELAYFKVSIQTDSVSLTHPPVQH
jgi:hypothetical protein